MRKRTFMIVATAVLMMAAPLALAQDTVQLRNAAGGDGTLEIWPDAYGAWSDWTFPNNFDRYDPAGDVGAAKLSFASNVMIYDPVLQDRLALAEPGRNIDTTYNNRGAGGRTLDYELLSALVASDTTGNGLDDTANSSFRVFGTANSGDPTLRLTFDLAQNVTGPDPNGVATYTKTYTITNTGANAVSIQLEQHNDFDILFDGGFSDPSGTDSAGGFRNPYMQEPDDFPGHESTKVALSGSGGAIYNAGRTQSAANGAPNPPYTAGTNPADQWARFGMPHEWRNHTVFIGYNMDGIVLDRDPPLGGGSDDGQMSLMWELTIEPKAVCEVVIVHTYGASTPLVPGLPAPDCLTTCDACDMNCDDEINAFDIENFLDLLFNPDVQPCCGSRAFPGHTGDVNGDGIINAFDIDPFLECLFGP